ncbi:MAG TPA: type III pantothenate kinase, partial [Sphingobacteriaceae bacterium]|nr:type III pantothenate kinase [Sphingobacteriaceae bacterium]
MTNLVIDIGNTLAKLAVFNDRSLSDLQLFADLDAVTLGKYLEGKQIDYAIISSVEKDIKDLEYVVESSGKYFRFSANVSSHIKNHYKTAQTLGLDRYAAVIGAEAIFPSSNCLVIDAGSCITYDFIDSKKNYYGGSISPGITMRFQAMHTFTERLPLIEPDADFVDAYGT